MDKNINSSESYEELDKFLQMEMQDFSNNNNNKSANSIDDNNPMFLNIRSDNEFANVEKRLINSNCLDKNYNKASSDCFYVIIEGEVYCVCHSNMNAIDKNIKWINKLMSNNKTDEIFDYLITLLASQICLVGLFCRK